MSDIVICIAVEEVIAAPATIVYDLISDLTRMGEWSPENLGSVWVEGPPASVGSRFMGRNRKGEVEWEGGGIVITASRPTEIAWAMGDDPDCPRGTWRYLLTEDGSVTRVVERYELGPGPSGFRDSIAARPVADQPAAIAARRDELHRAMQPRWFVSRHMPRTCDRCARARSARTRSPVSTCANICRSALARQVADAAL